MKHFTNYVLRQIDYRGIVLQLALVLSFCSAFSQLPSDFQRVDLITGLTNSVNFEFAPDGRVFIVDRYGELLIYKPDQQLTVSAGTIEVFHELEDGLLGIEFDPNFLSNNHIYLHYSPLSTSVNRVSRFTMIGDVLDTASEVVLLEWPTQREICCHAAGDLDFDSQGNLYIATGDNTQHSLYSPLDETDPNLSAEKSSSNTNDLRGKILRITPQPDGSYTTPADNLFPGGVGGLPEIFVMGARNPYKIFVDRENTDWLFWGEVGPDANVEGQEGPEGLDEINLTKNAGNFGWPYLSGKNQAYRNDYANPPFYYEAANPVNISIWNTGETNLPPAEPAWIELFHESYLAGPRYYFDPTILDQQKLPIEFDEVFFYYDFNTSQIWAVQMDEQGNILTDQSLAPNVFPSSEAGFIDMKIGPDGHMYILEYGAGCCPGNVGTGKLVRVDYIGVVTNSSPVVVLSADPTSGSLPLNVDFTSAGTFDPDGDPLTYEWDFDGDGIFDSNLENPSYSFTIGGQYNVQLRVSDNNGGVSTGNVTIHAGNNATTFNFVSPPDGGLVDWNDDISLEVTASDLEDGAINCTDLSVVPSIGHLNHFHDDLTIDGCPKIITLDPQDHDIYGEMDIFFVLGVNFTDQGGLTSFDQIRLHPKRTEAEFYDSSSGIAEINNSDPWGGGSQAIRTDHDGYISLEGRNLSGINSVRYRVASATTGGRIELRLDGPTGNLISTTNVPTTGAWNNWIDVESPITDPGGKHDLYFVFKNNPGETDLFNVNWVEFSGNGVSIDNTPPEVVEVIGLNTTTVNIEFSEEVSQASAENTGNYQVDNGVVINSAVLQDDNRTVILTTTPITQGVSYSLSISGVQNEAGIAIVPDSYSFTLFETIRINTGGPELTAGGNIFSEDQYANGGNLYENIVGIGNTTDDALYQTERWGDFTYSIPVPGQGAYDVRLHFAELYYGVEVNGSIGDRVFNVSMEGNQVLTNFDMLAEVAPATALVKEINDVIVNDGILNIEFTGVVENPKISAIEILDPNTFTATPSITIISPAEGAQVNQPFQVGFSIQNWEVAQGSTHMHYFVDGLMIGPHYSLNPITFDDLSVGPHTIRIELFEASHTATGIFDEITVNVTDQIACLSNPFPDQWDEHLIDGALPYRSVYILPQQDIDGDGLKDIVTGGWWYKNPGSADGNWVQNVIGSPFNNVTWIYDFDGDGDQDLFGTQGQYESADLVWAENNGTGNFTIHADLPSGTTSHDEIFIAGIAGGVFQAGGPYQMAITWNGAENGSSQVQMVTVPSDPVSGTWTIENIHPTSIGEGLSAGDIDGDGDLDLFQAGNWLRNDGGSWTLFDTGITFNSLYDRNRLTDIDQDGDLDGVAGQIGTNEEVAWLEAPEDPTQLWTKQVIDPLIDGTLSLGVADMDSDGDQDIIVGEFLGDHKLFGFENDLCNSGGWIKHTIDEGGDGLDHHDGSQLVDIDNDGDLDIVTIGWNQIIPRIFENLSGPIIVNLPPVLESPTDQVFSLGEEINLQVSGTDPNPGDVLTYSADGLPGDLSIDQTSGLISGTLTAPIGDYEVTVTLTDQGGLFVQDVFTISISDLSSLQRINSGGPGFSFGSEDWIADQFFTGGMTFSTTSAIAGTTNDVLYQTERYADAGSMSYEVPLPAGDYQVRLHFAEIFYTSADARVFDVNIEGGQGQLTDYDIFAAAGGVNTAVIETFMVTVADGGLSIVFTSKVENAKISGIEILGDGNLSPLLVNPGDQQYTSGDNVNLQLEGSDPNSGDVLTYSADGLPGDLSIDQTSGLISGTLTAPNGDYEVTVTLTDQDGLFAQEVFTITISDLSSLQRINSGGPAFTFGNEDWIADQYFTGGLTFSTTSAIAGTNNDLLYQTERYTDTGGMSYEVPLPAGDYQVRLHFAEIFYTSADSRIFDVDIEGGQGQLTDYDIFAAAGGINTAVIETFMVTVADGGLSIVFTSKVENAKISGIEILGEGNLSPLLVNPGDQQYASGVEVNLQLEGSDPNPGDILTYSADGLPGDLSIDQTSGLISGTLTAPIGDYEVTVTLTDQDGLFDEKQFTISVTGSGNITPTLTNPGNIVYNGGSVNLQLIGIDLNSGDVLTYTASGLPNDLSIDPSTGLISGTLTDSPGDYTVTARVTDQEGLFDEITFTITITDFVSVMRINSGGPGFVNSGEQWSADQYFNGGLSFTTTTSIAGTSNEQLYQSERYAENGTMSYSIPLPAGDYQVVLHFAEIFHTSAGARVFDVNIENGQGQLIDYDIYVTAGGAYQAVFETFNVSVTDGELDITFNSTVELAKISGIEINGMGNIAPVVNNPGNQQYNVGSSVSLQLEGSDLNVSDILSYGATGLPEGLTIDSSTGLISGILSASPGDYTVTVSVTDSGGLSDQEVFTISITDFTSMLRINAGGPSFVFGAEVWDADQYFTGGSVFSTTVAIAGTTNDMLYQTERYAENGSMGYAVPLPPGNYQLRLHFAEIYHTTEGARVFDVNIESGQSTLDDYDIFAKAGANTAVIETFQLSISDGVLNIDFTSQVDFAKVSGIEITGLSPENSPPQIAAIPAQTVSEGTTLEIEVQATDPDGDIASLSVDFLPPFASFSDNMDGTGTIFLSPGFNDFGTYNITVTATDPEGLTDSERIIIQVVEEFAPPVLSNIDDITIAEGEELVVGLNSQDPDGQIPVLSISGEPDFVSLTDNMDGTGELLIAPGFNQAGTYTVDVTATDVDGMFVTQTVTITVIEINAIPEVVVETNLTVQEGSTLEVEVLTSDADGEIPTLTASNLPPFVSLTDNGDGTGTLSINPEYNQFGQYSFTITGTDAAGAYSEIIIVLNVTEISVSPEWQVEGVTSNANCQNENGSVTLSVSGGFGAISYQWSNGATTKDLENLTAGMYTVTITDEKNNVTTESYTINLQPGPQKPNITRSEDILVVEETAFAYQWLLNGEELLGETQRTLTISLSGEYSVVISDELGCLTQSDPMVIEFEQSSINYFPNPTRGEFFIDLVLVEDQTISFVLLDDIGRTRQLGVFDLKAGRHKIPITLDESLANGTYTIMADKADFVNNHYRILLIR